MNERVRVSVRAIKRERERESVCKRELVERKREKMRNLRICENECVSVFVSVCVCVCLYICMYVCLFVCDLITKMRK